MTKTMLRAAVTGTNTPAEVLLRAGNAGLVAVLEAEQGVGAAPALHAAAIERVPVCSPTAAAHLRLHARLTVHAGVREDPVYDRVSLVKDWCLAASRRGVHAAHHTLPFLLALGERRPDARPFVAAVVGERGRWFADEIGVDWLDTAGEIVIVDTPFLRDSIKAGPWLETYHAPWTAALTEAYVAAVLNYVAVHAQRLGRFAKDRLPLVGVWGPLEAGQRALAMMRRFDTSRKQFKDPSAIDNYEKATDDIARVLAYRKTMHAAFEETQTR